MAKGRGKPSKLTEETKDRLLRAIRNGVSYKSACAYAGIHYATFCMWRSKGEAAPHGQYREFLDSVEEAMGVSEVTLVGQLRARTPNDWRAVAWMLERRFPDTWGSQYDKLMFAHRMMIETFAYFAQQAPASLYLAAMQIFQAKLPTDVIDVLPVALENESNLLDPASLSTDELMRVVENQNKW